MFQKSSCTSLSVRVIQREFTFQKGSVNSVYDRTRCLCQKQTTHNHLLHRKFNRHRKVRKVTTMNLRVAKKEIFQKRINGKKNCCYRQLLLAEMILLSSEHLCKRGGMYNTEIFFQILLVGMGFEHWEVGFRKKNRLGNGTGTSPTGPSLQLTSVGLNGNHKTSLFMQHFA